MEENESELFNEVYKEICEAIGLDGASIIIARRGFKSSHTLVSKYLFFPSSENSAVVVNVVVIIFIVIIPFLL